MDSVPSEELMAKAAEGDEFAFQILVHRHQTSVLNLIYRYVGDRTMAGDLAQEVFIRVWRAAKNYEPRAKFTTWVFRITANLCLNEMKSFAVKKSIFAGSPVEEGQTRASEDNVSPSPEEILLGEERSRQISQALQSLPGNQRLALILKRYDGLSYDEIARVMRCSVSALESLLVRAKRNLQEKLILSEK